jgi:hypothetical protein
MCALPGGAGLSSREQEGQNMKFYHKVMIALGCIFLSGCASGPQYSEIRSSIMPLKSSEGRIYFFRKSLEPGLAVQPTIYVNGQPVGTSTPNGFFYIDHAPGPIEVKTATEVEEKITFKLMPGQTRYVRTYVGMGLMIGRVYPELIDSEQGASEVQQLSYTGRPMAAR